MQDSEYRTMLYRKDRRSKENDKVIALEKEVQRLKQEKKEMIERACEYKNEITDLKMKKSLDKEYELVEVNWYKAPRYKRKKAEEIMRYTKMCIAKRFPHLDDN